MPTPQDRNKQIQLIHVAARDLGIDRETYEAILFNIGGKASSAKLTGRGREKVLSHFKSMGWKPFRKSKPRQPRKPGSLSAAQEGYIYGLWADLARAGIVRDGGKKALRSWLQAQSKSLNENSTAFAAVEFLTKDAASIVIEMLKKWQRRTGADSDQ